MTETEDHRRDGHAPLFAGVFACAVQNDNQTREDGPPRSCLPKEPKMNTICAMVQTSTGMSVKAISKALSRVAADIWDYGNRDKLCQIYGRPVLEKPTPKELIFVLAVHCQAPESRSRVVTTLLPDPVS